MTGALLSFDTNLLQEVLIYSMRTHFDVAIDVAVCQQLQAHSAPFSGEKMFGLQVVVAAPSGLSMEEAEASNTVPILLYPFSSFLLMEGILYTFWIGSITCGVTGIIRGAFFRLPGHATARANLQ